MIELSEWIGLELGQAEKRAEELFDSVEILDITGRKQPRSDCKKVVAVRERGRTLLLICAGFLTEIQEKSL